MGKSVDDVRAAFLELYREWFARVGGDPGDFFERVLAPDWVYIDYDGVRRIKPDYEPYIAGVPRERAPREARDLHVRMLGEVAIVDGSYDVPGGGTGPDRRLRFTAVWVDRGGSWQALAHHTSVVTGTSS